MSDDKLTPEQWASLQASKNVAALKRLMEVYRKEDEHLRETDRRVHWTLVFVAAFAQRTDMHTVDKMVDSAELLIDYLDRKGYFPD